MATGQIVPRPPLGWPLLPVPDAAGRLAWPSLDQSVRDQIRVVLSTRPGEQLMRPDFGGGLELVLHEPDTLATRRRIRELVQGALARWEPRIVVDRIEVLPVEGEPGHLRVEVAYRLVRDGSTAAVAVTVQMEG